MKVNVFNKEGAVEKEIALPPQFEEEYRPDLIKRAVLAIQSHKRQPYGAMPEAGERPSGKLSKRRRKYRGSYGKGISRVPRKILSRRGLHFYWVGAFVPGTVGGRKAHPPKAEKIWWQKINEKERKKALCSAIAATALKELIKERYSVENVPIVVNDSFESISKTKEVKAALLKLGLEAELNRTCKKKVRAGKGKSRGRKYRQKKGILFVVSQKCPLQKSAANIPGSDIAIVDSLNAELLAPGAVPGRLTIWTEGAIKRLETERLYLK